MNKSRKILSLVLSLAMVFALASCAPQGGEPTTSVKPSESTTPSESQKPVETPSADLGTIALVTDVGTIDDEAFNQAAWRGVEAYGEASGVEYTYYQPSADSTDARLTSIAQAVKEGAKVIVCPGFMFAETLITAQKTYPDVKFIGLDVSEFDMGNDIGSNVYCAVFAEEQSGYLAGYGAVKDGFTKLGFLGGMAVPAVQRFGYGYVQGANAAAEEMGVDIEIKYTYGGQFFGDANITAKMEGWYSQGTEVVFACGGGIWSSAAEAALNHEGYVIGVDVDQHSLGNNPDFAYNPFITSATKGLKESVVTALTAYYDGKWDTIGGKAQVLNLQGGDYVNLPTEGDSWAFRTFTQDEYHKIVEGIKDGSIKVSDAIDAPPTVGAHTTFTMIE